MTVSVKFPPILIKRYADGRLYDTLALRFLSLEDLRFWKARAIAFIVIDAETPNPIIYTGSNNLSENSTHHNDENLLEIKGSPELAQTYFAEFMRLYEHYRARALWNMSHPPTKSKRKTVVKMDSKLGQTFTLKTTRNAWVKGAYKAGTSEYLARTLLAGAR